MPEPELTVRNVMQTDPVCLGPTDRIQDALNRMNDLRVGAVLVIDADQQLLGIFTERDFLRQASTAQPGWRNLPVADWMSPQPYTISPDAGWEEAVTSMYRLRVRHLPVIEGGRVIGIVSARQLIGKRAEHLDALIGERTRELRRANDSLLARDSEVTHYMKVAARLQKRLVLPNKPPTWPEMSWGVHFAPLDPLGGDFYDFAQPDENHLGILIADSSGHSIPAALIAILARFGFQEVAPHSINPAEVLDGMNRRLAEVADDRFVTAFYCLIDRRNRELVYANAGHPFPLHYSVKSRGVTSLSARGFPLGIMVDEQYREKRVSLEPGDRLCFYTDGLPDLCNDQGESFGSARLSDFLAQCGDCPVSALSDGLSKCLKSFQGDRKATDDLTFLLASVDC